MELNRINQRGLLTEGGGRGRGCGGGCGGGGPAPPLALLPLPPPLLAAVLLLPLPPLSAGGLLLAEVQPRQEAVVIVGRLGRPRAADRVGGTGTNQINRITESNS